MSWAEIKHATNSTLGKGSFSSLDKIVKSSSYRNYYDIASHLYANDDDVFIVPWREELSENDYTELKTASTIILPPSLLKINANCFANGSVKKIILPPNLEIINHNAFAYCLIQEIVLPSSIKSISALAFSECARLYEVWVPWSQGELIGDPWGADYAVIHYNTKGI